jgi:expansin (peptidoglycan-binding protein)
MKSGVSQYWFSAQVINAHRRTKTLEVSIDQGKTWKMATRTTYNFFEISSGVGASSAWIRLTSETGTQVVVKNVAQTSDAVVVASGNYA